MPERQIQQTPHLCAFSMIENAENK